MGVTTARGMVSWSWRILFAALVATAGCAAPEVEEEQGSTTSNLSGCELLAGAAGASAAVAVSAASATGTCASGAAAAAVVTGGVAAPGSVVCLAPAAASGLAAITGMLAGGIAYLVCGRLESRVEPADEAPAQPSGPASRVDRAECEGRNPRNISTDFAEACPYEGRDSRLDIVTCSESFAGGPSDYTDPSGRRWNCGGKSPHHPCYPTLANGGDATHRHYYTTRYNYSAAKACCFYSEREYKQATCGYDYVP